MFSCLNVFSFHLIFVCMCAIVCTCCFKLDILYSYVDNYIEKYSKPLAKDIFECPKMFSNISQLPVLRGKCLINKADQIYYGTCVFCTWLKNLKLASDLCLCVFLHLSPIFTEVTLAPREQLTKILRKIKDQKIWPRACFDTSYRVFVP